MNRADFYKSLTESSASFAKAARTEHTDYSNIEFSMERAREEGFRDGLIHAFTLLAGYEPDIDEYETSCEDALCDGKCDSNYCENYSEGEDD